MNLSDEGASPWSDERSNSPQQTTNGMDLPGSDDKTSQRSTTTAAAASKGTTSGPASSVPIIKAAVKTPGGRSSRTPRKYGAQTTRLEVVDDTSDPLGPLGESTSALDEPEPPPTLPQKETQIASRNPRPSTANSQSSRGKGRLDTGLAFGEHDSRQNNRSNAATAADGPQEGAASNVEQAERPSFYISVGDPHKVGDLTSSHMAYQVRTKTTSKAYRQPEFEVSRRYRDFLWLYNQLHNNNPGVVVPPPPEKQAMGRYESDFVESRRAALDRMLNKTASHPILQHDTDLKIFLESEAFSVDVKQRDKKDPDMPSEGKGMFGGLNLSVGSGAKFVEHDDWFLERRVYLDNLEVQLRALAKAVESSVAQRKQLSEASFDLSTSLNSLSQVELSPTLTGPLASLSDLHLRIRDLYARQAQQDVLTLSSVIDEYVRLIGSVKKAFEQRQKSWQGWHNAESDLQKRRSALDKLHRQGRTQQDRIATLQADVADAERRAHQARLTFEDLGRGMRIELERFEKEKVEDFRMGVETYLESAVEAQKELIELWETYLMHLDADAEETEEEQFRGAGSSTGATSEGPVHADHGHSSSTENASGEVKEDGGDITEHDGAAARESTGKPATDASAAAAAAIEAESQL